MKLHKHNIFRFLVLQLARWLIDIQFTAAYITLRVQPWIGRDGHAQHQSRTAQALRQFEPPPRAGTGRLVPDGHFLRRSRSGPGQVRDASASSARRPLEGRRGCTLRGVSSHVLSGRSGSRSRRIGRPAAAPAGTQGRPQAHRRDHALYRTATVRRSAGPCPRTRTADQGRTAPVSASSQHRTRSIERALARKKKPRTPPPR